MARRCLAWKCQDCTCLTIRLDIGEPPECCDRCGSPDIRPFPLR